MRSPGPELGQQLRKCGSGEGGNCLVTGDHPPPKLPWICCSLAQQPPCETGVRRGMCECGTEFSGPSSFPDPRQDRRLGITAGSSPRLLAPTRPAPVPPPTHSKAATYVKVLWHFVALPGSAWSWQMLCHTWKWHLQTDQLHGSRHRARGAGPAHRGSRSRWCSHRPRRVPPIFANRNRNSECVFSTQDACAHTCAQRRSKATPR